MAEYTQNEAYTDCFATEIAGNISLDQYVEAFYTTWLFKLERWILKWAASRPSTDAQARQLALGSLNDFAAWRVEGRNESQLLMSDFRGRTRSWLMVEPAGKPDQPMTRLYFGSAVVPVKRTNAGKPSMGFMFRALLGFHKVYSIALLHAARSLMIRQEKSK